MNVPFRWMVEDTIAGMVDNADDPGRGRYIVSMRRAGLGDRLICLGAAWCFAGERNPDYFIKDRPYLDGYKFFVSTETSARAAAIRSGRAYIEFRTMPLAEVEAIKKQLGDKVVVQDTPATGIFGIAVNQTVKPFNDERIRKALTLGLDRYTASRVLYPIGASKTSAG